MWALVTLPNENGSEDLADFDFSFSRSRPITTLSLSLFVKYGKDVTVAEAQAAEMVCRRLQARMPTPEIFGWAEEGEGVFIYMELVNGSSLRKRWSGMDSEERTAVCAELKAMADA